MQGKTADIKTSLNFRKNQLKKLHQAILDYEGQLYEAIFKDLGKSKVESYATEIGFVLSEINFCIKKLNLWMKPKRVRSNWLLFPFSSSHIHQEPLGKILIISPWNYPFMLSISPVIGALAAGNQVTLKPSEMASNTAQVLDEMINSYFDKEEVKVVQGGPQITQQLLKQKWDHIFFTGSEKVGRIVMETASQNLSPVTLELGGKSPCVVTHDCDLEKTARRIVFGKFINAGQTCIAPDYLLVDKKIKDQLIDRIKTHIQLFFGEHPENSKDYGNIINDFHFERLCRYLDEVKVLYGGQTNKESKFIAPTLVEEGSDKTLMSEEIFGPILPVICYNDLNEALVFIKERAKPLALYIFSENKKIQYFFLNNTSSGGVCINDTLLQITNKNLPFGGVGPSGFGRYHGKAGFETFSNSKSVFKNTTLFDIPLRFPPHHKYTLKFIKKLIQ